MSKDVFVAINVRMLSGVETQMVNAKKSPAKKSAKPAKQTSRCWPGFKPVAGMDRNEKGSCEPKAKQTPSEKKADARAAAASKRE